MQDKQLRDTLDQAKNQGVRMLVIAYGRLDRIAAAGAVLFLLATTYFSLFSVKIMGSRADLSFYDVLRMLNGGDVQSSLSGRGTGAGLYALLWLAAVIGPLLPSLWSNRRAWLAYFLPMAVWLIALFGVIGEVRQLMAASRELAGFLGNSRATRGMAENMLGNIWSGTTLGMGFYLSLAVAVFFTIRGVAVMRRRA